MRNSRVRVIKPEGASRVGNLWGSKVYHNRRGKDPVEYPTYTLAGRQGGRKDEVYTPYDHELGDTRIEVRYK